MPTETLAQWAAAHDANGVRIVPPSAQLNRASLQASAETRARFEDAVRLHEQKMERRRQEKLAQSAAATQPTAQTQPPSLGGGLLGKLSAAIGLDKGSEARAGTRPAGPRLMR